MKLCLIFFPRCGEQPFYIGAYSVLSRSSHAGNELAPGLTPYLCARRGSTARPNRPAECRKGHQSRHQRQAEVGRKIALEIVQLVKNADSFRPGIGFVELAKKGFHSIPTLLLE